MDSNAKICEACGTVAKPEDMFCLNCGSKLEDAGAPENAAAAVSSTPEMPEITAQEAAQPAAEAMPIYEVPAAQPGTVPPAEAMPDAQAYGTTAGPAYETPASPAYGSVTGPVYGASASPAYGAPAAPPPLPEEQAQGGYAPQNTGSWQQPYVSSGFGAQPSQAGYGGQPPQPAPAQPSYGAPQPQPGMPGYAPQPGQPGFGGQPQQPTGYPGGPQQPVYGGYGMPPANAPKKKSALPVVIICVAVAVLALIGIGLFLMFGNSAKKDYDSLVKSIVSATGMADVAAYQGQLDQFVSDNPKFTVDSDVSDLVAAGVAYDEADPDDEYRYTDAISELSYLENSSVVGLGSCASLLLDEVETAYDDYQTRMEEAAANAEAPATDDGNDATGADDLGPYDPASSPMPITGDGLGVIDDIDGDPVFSFEATNSSDKTIDYFEIIAFYYDENGNPLVGTDGTTWSYKVDDTVLEPGATHRPDVDGYWPMEEHPDAAYVVPLVVYTTFDDGSFWGEIILYEPSETFVDGLQQQADAIMAAAK